MTNSFKVTTQPITEFDSVLDNAGLTELEKAEITRLRRSNPLWKEYAPRWAFYQSAYEGGEEFATRDNLFQHQRENEADYDFRVDRLASENYCEPIVDFFTNFIYAEAIDRNGGSNEAFFANFVLDVDHKGTSLDDFMRVVSDDVQIYGMNYILVDVPPLPETDGSEPVKVITKQDEVANDLRAYWVIIRPQEIIEWQVDDFEVLIYAKRRQILQRITDGDIHHLELYTEFYPDHYLISELDVTDRKHLKLGSPKTLPNKFGVVPMVVPRFKSCRKHPHLGLSFLRDFAYNNREIMNLNSLLQEFLYKQAFNMLAMESESSIPLREQEDGVQGTANVMNYPKGAKTPAYVSPPVDPAKFIQNKIDSIVRQMYLRASQDAMNELFNGEKSSGFSQAQSFSKTVPFIASRADMLERTERQLFQLTLQAQGGKSWDGKIKYKDRYELTNLTSALTQLQILVRDFQIPSELFVKEQLKRMVHEFDGKLPVSDQLLIEKQIDDMNFTSWMADQRTAFVGAPPVSAAAQQKPKQEPGAVGGPGNGDSAPAKKVSGQNMTVSQRSTDGGEKTSATVKLHD